MSQSVEGRTRTFQSGAVLAKHLRVHPDGSGKLAAAAAADADGLGTLARAVFTVDDDVSVILANSQGTQVMVALVAIALHAAVYAAAGGKVAATGTILVGYALEAAAADGDWIEVLPA